MANIAVLGAGVVGLSTAVNIQERLPTARVTIIADKFDSDTTSAGAGGIFRPLPGSVPGVPDATLRCWSDHSFRYFDSLAHSAEAAQAGVIIIDGYELWDEPIRKPISQDCGYDSRECTQRELQSLPVKYPYGLHVRTLLVECRKYLPWLMQKFRGEGGNVISRRIENLEELVGRYDLVVNCTGTGSRTLLGDEKVRFQRGQAMRVSAPWLKSFYRVPAKGCAVMPCFDTVIVGVTRQLDDTTLEVRQSDADHLMKNALELVPALKDAPILRHWVGFRPYRDPLRLESEIRDLSNGTLKMVHNYGHGGDGVALSWGTAVEAADLVDRMVRQSNTSNTSKL